MSSNQNKTGQKHETLKDIESSSPNEPATSLLKDSDSHKPFCTLIDDTPTALECDAYFLASVLIEGFIKAIFLFVVLILILFLVFPLYISFRLWQRNYGDVKHFLRIYPSVFSQVFLILFIFSFLPVLT